MKGQINFKNAYKKLKKRKFKLKRKFVIMMETFVVHGVQTSILNLMIKLVYFRVPID